MMERKLQERTYLIGKNKEVTDLPGDLQKEVAEGNHLYLLAHLDDGVIWGYVTDKTLQLSSQAFPDISPELHAAKLWELRLFGTDGEWHVWRSGEKLFSQTITEGMGNPKAAFDEEYILWGTIADGDSKNGFQPFFESNLGIVHTPPAEVKTSERHSLKLVVRHYVEHDESGAAYVKISRLVDLKKEGAA